MTENKYAYTLFEQIDKELDATAKRIRNRIFSKYRDVPWTHEQYRSLQPIIREELDELMRDFLNSLENVGCVLPDHVLGFEILANDYDENGDIIGKPIREGAFPDYGEMWREFLIKRQSNENNK